MQPFAFYVRRSFDCRIREEATDVTAPVRNRFYVNLDEVRTERLTLIDPLQPSACPRSGRSMLALPRLSLDTCKRLRYQPFAKVAQCFV
jgi:hypothetical protein